MISPTSLYNIDPLAAKRMSVTPGARSVGLLMEILKTLLAASTTSFLSTS